MNKDLQYLTLHCSYARINRLLKRSRLPFFPLVDSVRTCVPPGRGR